MRSVSGEIVSIKPVYLSKAANILSKFVNTDNGASQAVSSYLRRASTSFNELFQFHKHPKASSHSTPKHKKHLSVDTNVEDLIKFDVGSLENSDEIKKYDENPIEFEQKGIKDREDRVEIVEVSLRKRDKKKKKIRGSLGTQGKYIPVEEDRDRMTEKVNSGIEEERRKEKKKKKRKSREADIGGDVSNSVEQSGSKKKKKRRRIEGHD